MAAKGTARLRKQNSDGVCVYTEAWIDELDTFFRELEKRLRDVHDASAFAREFVTKYTGRQPEYCIWSGNSRNLDSIFGDSPQYGPFAFPAHFPTDDVYTPSLYEVSRHARLTLVELLYEVPLFAVLDSSESRAEGIRSLISKFFDQRGILIAKKGRPGRKPDTKDIAEFANVRRLATPPKTWKAIHRDWIEMFPKDNRVSADENKGWRKICDTWRRFFGTKRGSQTRRRDRSS